MSKTPTYLSNPDPLLSPQNVSDYMGGTPTPQTLAKWRAQFPDRLPYIKIGSRVRYRKSVIDAYLAAQTVTDGAGVKGGAA